MPHFERTDNELEFFWGKKKGFGGPKKNFHLYESFTYDGDEYSLYDCAYFYKEDAIVPYIGKIIRIYESPDHKKKVQALWFFHPVEIRECLKDNHPLEKEIFLATGEGKGLFNINPLEAIAGKCNVVCTSTDQRNPQPSEEELKKADYIFYRTFDVGTYIISDKIGDNIAGIGVRFLFNKKGGQSTKGVATDMKAQGKVKIPNKGTFISLKYRAHSDKSEDATKDVATHMRAHGKVKILNRGTLISERDQVESDKLDDRARKKMKITGISERDKGDTRLCKSTDISDEDDRKTSNPRVPSEVKSKTRFAEESVCPEKESLKIKPDVQRSRPSNGTPVKTSLDHLPNEKLQKQTSEVIRKQKIDRKKWFKQEDKMNTATEEGTLVLLQNLDPSYTSRDVEELISCAFQRRCDARMIQWTTFSCPYSGRAFIIFRSKKDAAEVLKKLEQRSLILPNKRVLVGSEGLWEIPEQKYRFVGHLSLERNRFRMQREEMKNAVSTSHCSQPNTIEYEMAMDWEFLQEKLKVQWKALYKGHEEEIKHLKKMLKMK